MLVTILATMSVVATLQAPVATAPQSADIAPSSSVHTTRVDKEHLLLAKRAMANGEFDIARREFAAAAAEDRAAGELPVEAVNGLAHALYSQSYSIEAAIALEQLVNEATFRGDVNTAALALADAIWLNGDAGRRILARTQSKQLRKMLKDPAITVETRKAVIARLG